MKKIHSVSFRVNVLILLLGIIIGGGLVTAAYVTNTRQVDEFYMTKTTQTSTTIAAHLDTDVVAKLLEIVKADDYQALREEAEAAEDDVRIEQYLEEKGALEDYRKLRDTLASYRDLQGAKYVYLLDVNEVSGIYLCDPNEPLTFTGTVVKSAPEFKGIPANSHIDATVSHTEEYGWLCSAYDPIVTESGDVIASVGVDIDMTDIVNARHAFLWTLLALAAAVVLAAMLFTVWMMTKTVTKPIHLLSKGADEFADPTVEYADKKVIDLPIRSKDEIGDLYQKTRSMQQNLIDYMASLTKVTAEKERIGTELSIATRIQASMLPQVFPAYPDRHEFDLFASMEPAKEVGGDFYDFFLVDDDHLCIVMADVSGKGVPAALFMMASKMIIANNAMAGKSPAQVLYDTNTTLLANGQDDMFVTVWIGILEISTGRLTASNGGHEYPVLMKDGRFEMYKDVHSFLVAGMPGVKYKEYELQLNPGDKLFVYTDGVPEAQDSERRMFGMDRTVEVLNENREENPEELLKSVRKAVDAFVGDAEPFDDLTMLCLEYKGKQG
ncbi:MAG: SpoIIE family protein phosphatase [Clostridia bacterium]|nr:SpoIIE family protein phosphatase [Clostridia bacterium]